LFQPLEIAFVLYNQVRETKEQIPIPFIWDFVNLWYSFKLKIVVVVDFLQNCYFIKLGKLKTQKRSSMPTTSIFNNH
jgi:hypothetical protein